MTLKAQPHRRPHLRARAIAPRHQLRLNAKITNRKLRLGRPERHRINPRARQQPNQRLALHGRIQNPRQRRSLDHVAKRRLRTFFGNERNPAQPPFRLHLQHRLGMRQQLFLKPQRPENPPAPISDEIGPAIRRPFPGRRPSIRQPHRKPPPRERQRQRHPHRPATRNGDVTTMGFGGNGHAGDLMPDRAKWKRGISPLNPDGVIPDARASVRAGTQGRKASVHAAPGFRVSPAARPE